LFLDNSLKIILQHYFPPRLTPNSRLIRATLYKASGE